MLSNEEIIILGDFIIHVDNSNDNDATKLMDMIKSLGLKQHVEEPTHIFGHSLDLVITRLSDDVVRDSPRVDSYISDHGVVLFKLNSVKPSLSVKTVSYRKYKAINIQDFQSDLAKSALCTNHPNCLDELVSCYDKTLKATLDKHAPLLTKTVVVRPRVPWFNEEMREAKRERRKAEKKWRKTKNAVDLTILKVKGNAVVSLMNKARKEFYTNFIEENSCDQRKLFKASKGLLNCKPCNAIPPDIDEKQLAENIGNFFVQKVLDIRNRLGNIHSSCEHETSIPYVAPTVQYIREFDKLTKNDVKSIMQRSSLRSCLLDPMPSWLVNQCDVLLPVLTTLINTSLQSVVNSQKHGRKPWYYHF